MDLKALSTYISKNQGSFLEGHIFGQVKPSTAKKGRSGKPLLAITPAGPVVVPAGVTVRLHAGQAVYHGADEGSSTLIGLNVGDGEGGFKEARLLFRYRNTSVRVVGPATAKEVLVIFSRHVALEGARNSVLADTLASTCEGGEDEWEEEGGESEEEEELEALPEEEEGADDSPAAVAAGEGGDDGSSPAAAAAAASAACEGGGGSSGSNPAATGTGSGSSGGSDWKKKLGVIPESEIARFVLPSGQDVMPGEVPCPVLDIYPDPISELSEDELLHQCKGYESRCKFDKFEVYSEELHGACVATVLSEGGPSMPQYMPCWSEPDN